jgi:hypothetical protein
MKQIKTLFMLLLVASFASAQDRSDVFKHETKIIWLGLDFSEAKLIGDRERLGSESDIKHLMEAWNNLIINEGEKYDLAKAFDKATVERNIQPTLDNNAGLDGLSLVSNSEKDYLHLTKDGVAKIVSGYSYKGNTGVGLMFNIESFSKINEEASLWVTFIDINSKQVLFTERLTGKPKGFGLRNFWGGAIYGILEQIKKKEYENWRKKYSR